MNEHLDTDVARLDDYLRGHDSDTDAAAFEDELFARAVAGRAPELQFLTGLRRSFRQMEDSGTIELWLTAREADALAARNRRVFRFDLDISNPRSPRIPDDAEILVTRIPLDLRGVEKLDAEVLNTAGHVLKSMPDVKFEPDDGAIYACCEAELARVANVATTVTRVWATTESQRRLLATIPIGF